MTIENLIEYYTELAKESESCGNKASNDIAKKMCEEDTERCKQTATWLEELKEYRRRYGSLTFDKCNTDLHKFKCENCGYEYEFDKNFCTLNVSIGLREPLITSNCPKCDTRNEEIRP